MALDDREANKSARAELHSREDYFTSSLGLDHQVLKGMHRELTKGVYFF